MCPRTEEREGNGNFGLVEIKGATKPRERERGEEQWRCKVAPCGYRGVNHITPVHRGVPSILRFAARVEICYVILNAQNDPLAFSNRERLVCVYSSRDECERGCGRGRGVGVTQRGNYVTHHLRRQIIGKKFALRFLEFEKVWKRERGLCEERIVFFFLAVQSESSARARDRAIDWTSKGKKWNGTKFESKKTFLY